MTLLAICLIHFMYWKKFIFTLCVAFLDSFCREKNIYIYVDDEDDDERRKEKTKSFLILFRSEIMWKKQQTFIQYFSLFPFSLFATWILDKLTLFNLFSSFVVVLKDDVLFINKIAVRSLFRLHSSPFLFCSVFHLAYSSNFPPPHSTLENFPSWFSQNHW
jgi:hypothetical protein